MPLVGMDCGRPDRRSTAAGEPTPRCAVSVCLQGNVMSPREADLTLPLGRGTARAPQPGKAGCGFTSEPGVRTPRLPWNNGGLTGVPRPLSSHPRVLCQVVPGWLSCADRSKLDRDAILPLDEPMLKHWPPPAREPHTCTAGWPRDVRRTWKSAGHDHDRSRRTAPTDGGPGRRRFDARDLGAHHLYRFPCSCEGGARSPRRYARSVVTLGA
jgi:hypothetical protein